MLARLGVLPLLMGCGVSHHRGGGFTGIIGPDGGRVSGSDGASVEVPPGALAEPTEIGVNAVESGFPALPANVAPGGPVYAFTPHGQTFDLSVTVTVPFDVAASPNLRLVTAAPDGAWTDVAASETDRKSVV